MTAPLWTPSRERREGANLTRYARWLTDEHGVELPEYDYRALWRWSVDHLEECYASLWEYFAIDSDDGYERVLGRAEMPGAQWFPGARVNYAEHVFRGKPDDALAVQFASETAPVRSWTWGELRARTAAMAAGGRALTTEPSPAITRIGRKMPAVKGTSSSIRQRNTYIVAASVTGKFAFTEPWTCGAEPVKSTIARPFAIVTATPIQTGSAVMPSLSRQSSKRYTPRGSLRIAACIMRAL